MRPLALYTTLLLLLFHLSMHAQDGSLDTSFGNGGKVTTTINGKDCIARAIALQDDGKIIAAGNSSDSLKYSYALVRYLTHGRRDTTFGTDGIVLTSVGENWDIAFSVLVQPDGKIVAAGTSAMGNTKLASVARFNADGTLDSTFNQNGKMVFPSSLYNSSIIDIALQSDNKIVFTGNTKTNNDFDIFVARLLPNGQLDPDFGTDGIKVISLSPISNDKSFSILIEPDQKIVIAGETTIDKDRDIILARLLTDGNLDPGFGVAGISQLKLAENFNEDAHDFKRLENGKFVTVGVSTAFFYSQMLAQFNNNGTIDSTFGTNGVLITGSETDLSVSTGETISIQADGRIITAGFKGSFDTVYFGVSRFTANGKIDSTFGNNGIVLTSFNGSNDQWPFSSVIQPDGKIVVAGVDFNPPSKFALARYNAGNTVSTGKPLPVSDGLKVYPNPCPANGNLTVHHPNLKEAAAIEIITLNGTSIGTYKTQRGSSQSTIHVPNLVPGVYIVRTIHSNNRLSSTFLTIQ